MERGIRLIGNGQAPVHKYWEELLEMIRRGELDPAHAAYLHDRIGIREGRPQRYRTQVGPAGQPFPLEPGDVDARRAGVGLGPLEIDLVQFRG